MRVSLKMGSKLLFFTVVFRLLRLDLSGSRYVLMYLATKQERWVPWVPLWASPGYHPLGPGALTGPTAASWPRPARGTAARGPAAPSWPARSGGRTGHSPARPRCPARPHCTGSSGCRSAAGWGGDRVKGVLERGPPHAHTPTLPNSPPAQSRTVEELRLDTEELVVSRLLGGMWPFCGDTRPGDP